MRLGKLVLLTITFLFVTLILAIGGLLVAFPHMPHIHDELLEIIKNHPQKIAFYGWFFVAVGLFAMSVLYYSNKRAYFHTIMGDTVITLDSKIIERYIEEYWKNNFPTQKVNTDVIVEDENIEIVATFSNTFEGEIEDSMQKAEIDIKNILVTNFNYSLPFRFSFSIPTA